MKEIFLELPNEIRLIQHFAPPIIGVGKRQDCVRVKDPAGTRDRDQLLLRGSLAVGRCRGLVWVANAWG